VVADVLPKNAQEQTRVSKLKITEPVILRHQDNGFSYIAPVEKEEGERDGKVIAVDTKTIRVIRFLSGYVRFERGNRINFFRAPDATPEATGGGSIQGRNCHRTQCF
jgi:hypothetical protein